MCSDFRFGGRSVFPRFVGISALIAVLFVAACNTNKPVVFGVVTTSAQLPAGQINVAYTQTTLTAANGTVPYMFAVTGGALPAGMTLSSAGVLSGTPTASGSFNFTVTATDSDKPTARTATASLTLKVNAPPAITSGASTTFTVGSAGTFTVTATGFPAPTFSETGALPSGVTLNSSSGVLSGTPAAGTGGTYPITITAQNGATPNATQSFTLTVDQAPAITSANSAGFVVSTAGTFTVTASGFPAPTIGESGPLPTGVTFNAATGVLSGTPAVATQGSYPITFTAQNGVGANATQNFTLTVGLAPAVTSASSTTFTVGSAGTFTVTATGFPVPTYSETGPLPSGVSLNPTSGVLSGTPAAGTGGSYSITITAQNGIAPNATQNFTLKVNQAPAITSANTTSFTVASFGSFAVTATGFPAPTFSETGPLPSGVTLNSASGLLSGTPAGGTQGSYPITITAQNAVGANATQNFTLNVDLSPTITSLANATFTVGSAGTFTVTATGFPAPTFGESGALPTGLSFNTTTGVLSGTPAANTGGTYSLQFTAQNGVNPNATQIFSLTINQAPAITSAASTTFAVGSNNSFTVTASGFPAPTLSQTGTLPSGVTFNTATGVLSGTPASGTQGSYPITFTAQNGVGTNANQSFTLTVSFTAPPSITSANSTTFTVGSAGTFAVTATGAPAPTFGETGTLPSGVTLNPTTGVLSGTPAAGTGGNYSITITAQNGISPNASQPFTLTVDQAPAITSGNNTTFTVGANGTFTVTATGFPALTFSETGTLPNGVSLSPAGVLSGTPASGTQGSYPITITAQNGVSPNATQSFTLTVNTAPSFTSLSTTTFTVGSPGTFTVTASGSPVPTLGETGALPNGVTFNSSTGVLSGTPAVGSGGVYSITFTATNGVNPNSNQNFTLTVDEGPAITSNNSTTFTVGVSGTFNVNATGEPAATLSETGSLPSGVTFTPNSGGTATLSGAPATGTGGSYPITITAHNGIGTDATQSFTLTVITDPCASAGTGVESLLNGHYAFVLKGFDNGQGTGETAPEPALVGGVLTFNGTNNNGLITAGVVDMNLNAGTQTSLTVTAGSYKVGSDHRACLTITTSAGTQHYRGSLGNISGGVASTGHLIGFDASGPFTAGVLRKQSSTVPTTLSGNFVFGVSSIQNTANQNGNGGFGGSFGGVGVMDFASNGTLTGGSVDFNQNGFLDGGSVVGGNWPTSPVSIVSGSYSIASNGRGTLTFTPSGATPVGSVIYVVSSSEVLILGSDAQASNTAFAGSALLQSGAPFAANPLSGAYVGYQSAMGSTAGTSSTTLLRLTPSGTGITGTQLRNDGGSFQSKTLPAGITYSVAGSGRMTIVQSGGTGNNNPPIFYLVSTNQAFALSSDNSVGFGFFQSQTSTSASGTYAFGTVDPQDPSLSDNSGVAAFATPNVNVTEDDNSNGSQNADQAQSFTFTVDSTGLGEVLQPPQISCTISATSTTCGTVFYVISPTKAVVMDTGTTNPKAQIADQ